MRFSFLTYIILAVLMLLLFSVSLIAYSNLKIHEITLSINSIKSEIDDKIIQIKINHDSLKTKIKELNTIQRINYLEYLEQKNDAFFEFLNNSKKTDTYHLDKKKWALDKKKHWTDQDSVFFELCLNFYNYNLEMYQNNYILEKHPIALDICIYNNRLLKDELKNYKDPDLRAFTLENLRTLIKK